MKKLIIILIIFTYTFLLNAQTNVLFLGNDIISVNNLPKILKDLASSGGENVYFEHWRGPANQFEKLLDYRSAMWDTEQKLLDPQHEWDYVIFLESDLISGLDPGFGPNQFGKESHNSHSVLNRLVRDTVTCAEPILLLSFAYENGDTIYKPGDTYLLHQERIRRNIMRMADVNYCKVAPVGSAWQEIHSDTTFIQKFLISASK